jgi:hypothetical protein
MAVETESGGSSTSTGPASRHLTMSAARAISTVRGVELGYARSPRLLAGRIP